MLANTNFSQTLKAHAAAVEAHLSGLIDTRLGYGPAKRLTEAMRYGLLGGGKRLRPFLVIESARIFGVPLESALNTAAALECVHCYSLIHDDLPAMDDDDLRRGRPSVHKAFDEATAILAGDGLLTFAFEILALPETHGDAAVRGELVLELARASGAMGMAGGQMLDLAAEGATLSVADIARLQHLKTGKLILFGCICGAILANATPLERAALFGFGSALGAAYQLSDDLLDVEGNAAILGKATAKDAGLGKQTLIARLGIEGARHALKVRVSEATNMLSRFGPRAALLNDVAQFMLTRQS